MPSPRKRPPRQGAYAEQVRASWVAAAYAWPCPTCPCTTNLRRLLRAECSHCGHEHRAPDAAQKELPHEH